MGFERRPEVRVFFQHLGPDTVIICQEVFHDCGKLDLPGLGDLDHPRQDLERNEPRGDPDRELESQRLDLRPDLRFDRPELSLLLLGDQHLLSQDHDLGNIFFFQPHVLRFEALAPAPEAEMQIK